MHKDDNYLLENGASDAMYHVLYGTTTGYTTSNNPFYQLCDGVTVPGNCSMFTFSVTGDPGLTVNGYNTRVSLFLC